MGFAHFYQRFIKGFSRIAALLTIILKITRLFIALASRVDSHEVISDSGGAGADGRNVGGSDTSKKSTKSKS